MDIQFPPRLATVADHAPPDPFGGRTVVIPQYPVRAIVTIWAAAAAPMAVLAWVVAPLLAPTMPTGAAFASSLILCLTVGLVWQFVLVMVLVAREQGNLRWATVRQALWLHAPRSPRTGRSGGRVWLMLIPFVVLFAAAKLVPDLPAPVSRDFGDFLASGTGQTFLEGAWGWFALIVVMGVFNTVLGEELLFRGFLLPRMGAFGRADWVVNGFLFALYHLHMPWVIPAVLVDTLALAYPSKRYRSAWMGIAVHSTQTIFLTIAMLPLVL